MSVEDVLVALVDTVWVAQKLEGGLEAWEMLVEYTPMKLNNQANRHYIGSVRLKNYLEWE